jgi:hypothetical protein
MEHDEIVNKRVCSLAADHGLTAPDTLAALHRRPIELDRNQFLRRTLAMELIELDQLQQAFRAKALEDRDLGSGLLLLKVAERRATLLGMNTPQGHAVQIIQHEPAAAQTSTGNLRAAIDRIQGRLPKPMSPTIPSRPSNRIRWAQFA